jgi:hypothetical protein
MTPAPVATFLHARSADATRVRRRLLSSATDVGGDDDATTTTARLDSRPRTSDLGRAAGTRKRIGGSGARGVEGLGPTKNRTTSWFL